MNFKIDKIDNLERVLGKLKEITSLEPLVVDIEKDSIFLQNPLSLEIFRKLAEEKKIPLQISIDGKPFEEESPLLEDKPSAEPPKTPPKLLKISKLPGFPSLGGIVAVRAAFLVAGIVILVLGSLFSLFYFMPRATISIIVENEILSKGVDVIASPSAGQIMVDERVIPAQTLSYTESGSVEVETTGEKRVGDRATGTATIYNKTESEKTFAKGASLFEIAAEGQGLEYIILEEVKVPARIATDSAEIVTYVSGKKDVSVEAVDIGDEYNLGEGEELSVEQFSTNLYVARTNEGISGGSVKIVKVVAQADESSAIESIEKDLTFKAYDSFKDRVGSGQFFDEKAVSYQVENSSANHSVGEEAEKLKVTQTINFKSLVFFESDLKSLMESLVMDFVPSNFSLEEESQDIGVEGVELIEQDGGNALFFTAKFRGLVVPELNANEMVEKLSGKSIAAAEAYLEQLPKKKGFDVHISPKLPGFLNRLPFRAKNIRVEVVSE